MSEDVQQEDRTEEASPERREEFREKGDVVTSREFTSAAVLAAGIALLSFLATTGVQYMEKLFTSQFESISTVRINEANIMQYAGEMWVAMLVFILPVFAVAMIIATFATFAQSRLNFSWKKVAPDFNRLNPITGLPRMVNGQAFVELIKSIAKILVISIVSWLILRGEWLKVPELMNYSILAAWSYWGNITESLSWAVCGLMLVIAGGDYFYNFISYERKIRMTHQEVKEEFKKRETDPHLKAKMRRKMRDLATRKTLDKTKEATVLITNPTHYSIALKYELGMDAPLVVAKGIDHLALKMREIAKEQKIPIIENRALARELYATVEEGEEISSKLYKVVSEIIKYVFQLKGRNIPRKKNPQPNPQPNPPPRPEV